MQRIQITQHELSSGTGNFHDYMRFVVQRLTNKSAEPKLALFRAADIIPSDGLFIIIVSYRTDAGVRIAN